MVVTGEWTGLLPVCQRLTYDTADRLTKVCRTATTCTGANQTVWSYKKNGNCLSEKAGAAAIATYTYDNADQLTAITGPGAKTFTSNRNGDQLTGGGGVSTLMRPVKRPAQSLVVATTSSYDGNGNRNTITTGGVPKSELANTQGDDKSVRAGFRLFDGCGASCGRGELDNAVTQLAPMLLAADRKDILSGAYPSQADHARVVA